MSTCNRTELVFRHGPLPAGETTAITRKIIDGLIARKNFESMDRSLFYVHHNEDAARHLFRVAAGLESMIVGEAQVLAQTKEAYRIACRAGSNGFLTNRLMHTAFRSG